MNLEKAIIEARRRWIDAGGYSFLVQRPTDEDLAHIRAQKMSDGIFIALALCKAHVVGWRGVKEAALVPSGGDVEAEFTPGVFALFLADRIDLWGPISDAIWNLVDERAKELEGLRGN